MEKSIAPQSEKWEKSSKNMEEVNPKCFETKTEKINDQMTNEQNQRNEQNEKLEEVTKQWDYMKKRNKKLRRKGKRLLLGTRFGTNSDLFGFYCFDELIVPFFS